ncbi:MAG: alkaline phosphatase family protein [Polyangiaceae bacterium]|nr:alkaline phosphatase family protein [Polyangiaceae bacterium]
MRRPELLLLALLSTWQTLGCTVPDEKQAPPEVLPGPAEWNRDVVPPADTEAETARAACTYTAGALPAETQGESRPYGKEIPIDHIVVVMMENRSFDHYFQKLPEYGQPDADVAPETYTNPDANGMPVAPFRDTDLCLVDTNHEWTGTHEQINGGQMDGFFATNDGWHELPAGANMNEAYRSGKRALSYYTSEDLPFYYWLANEFAIGDRYFSSMAGPTWPNRMYLYAASSFGAAHNTIVTSGNTLFDYLEQRQVSWKIYYSTSPGLGVLTDKFIKFRQELPERFGTFADYLADAAAGTLPSVAFVDPGIAREGYDQNDEHPPAIPMFGEQFVATVVDALTKSPQWSKSAFFLTYDEHGGFYDHVAPPKACPPDDIAPDLEPGDTDAKFDMLGVRVPFIVVSPYAKKHYVDHRTYDHTSIVRFIEARFQMPALSNRDANAEAPWEMFDFENPPHATPPTIALPPAVDQAKLDACEALFDP